MAIKLQFLRLDQQQQNLSAKMAVRLPKFQLNHTLHPANIIYRDSNGGLTRVFEFLPTPTPRNRKTSFNAA
jgi:hypothetical protein